MEGTTATKIKFRKDIIVLDVQTATQTPNVNVSDAATSMRLGNYLAQVEDRVELEAPIGDTDPYSSWTTTCLSYV